MPDDKNEDSYPAFALDFAKLCRLLARGHFSSGDAVDQVELGIMLFVFRLQTPPPGASKRIEFARRRDTAPEMALRRAVHDRILRHTPKASSC